MTDLTADPPDAWRRAITTMDSWPPVLRDLRSDYPATVEHLKDALAGGGNRDVVLVLLGLLGADYIRAVADRLVGLSVSHRYAGRVRELLGTLPHDEAARVVPAAVWHLLDNPGVDEMDDYDAYRRYAELFEHLGLSASLRELSQRALRSDDPDIREVGEDFAG